MLEQEIRANIEERQTLLLQIKTLHFRYGFNEKDEQVFLNYSIPIVYAIWEGFVQSAFRIYIEKLNNLNLTVDTVCKPILTHHLENKFKQFREYPKDTNKKVLFFDGLDQFYTTRVIEINSDVNTESNVGFEVINRLLKIFNLTKLAEYPKPEYSLSKELKRLLKIRNAFAHGQHSIIVHREDLENSIKLVEILMDLVLESIIKGFENKSYLHTP